MKILEEKAKEYAEAAFAKALKAPWPEAKQAFADAYIAGATEAFAGQWRRVEDDLPKDERDVFVRYVNYAGGVECGCAYYDGEDWYTTDGTHIRPTHWMPIPKLKDESE